MYLDLYLSTEVHVGRLGLAQSHLLCNHMIMRVTNVFIFSQRNLPPWGTNLNDSHFRHPDFTRELFPWADSLPVCVWVGTQKEKETQVFARGNNTWQQDLGLRDGGLPPSNIYRWLITGRLCENSQSLLW